MGFMATPRTVGPPSQPSISSGFSQRNIFMFKVAHLTDGGITILEDQPNLARRKLDMGIFPFLRHQLTIGSCAPDDLATLSDFQFDVMNQRASGNISEGKGIARFDIGCRACDHLISNLS